MAQGQIISYVYTSEARLPVAGATVILTAIGERGRELISVQRTDLNGLTQPVWLEAPPAAESREPGRETPYATLEAWAEQPGYGLIRVLGVQIFSGMVTRQEFRLIPLPDHAEECNPRETFTTGSQNL